VSIGIYRIKNLKNGKCYIGKSEVNIEERWKTHIRDLRNDNHRCNNGKRDKLQLAWNKYSEENFIFGVIEECEVEQCNEREIYWIAYYDSFKHGYNNTEGGEGISGWNHSGATKQKISEARTGEKHPMYGKQHSPETKQKMSKARTGRHHSPETRKKMSEKAKLRTGEKNPMYGQGYKLQGEKNPMYIPRTLEMIEDVKNNMNYKDFCAKYSVSVRIYYSIKKELGA